MGGSLGEQLQSAINAATMLMPKAVDANDAKLLNLDWNNIDDELSNEIHYADSDRELESASIAPNAEAKVS